MRVLIIHNEAEYFGGAEKMLHYFLEGAQSQSDLLEIAVAGVENSRVMNGLLDRTQRAFIDANTRFSIKRLSEQGKVLRRFHREFPFEIVHAWAARAWELGALTGWLSRTPVVGTLHDHPQSHYITRSRQILMRLSARYGMRKIICVSEAVRTACLRARYPGSKLTVAQNGLPDAPRALQSGSLDTVHLGFVGVFTREKGFDLLFEILDQLPPELSNSWRLTVVGTALDETGKKLHGEVEQRFSARPWWNQISWAGWQTDPTPWLQSFDLLIFPSRTFDSFPNVLLETARAGTAALAAHIGGPPEIIEDHVNGWLFAPGNAMDAATKLQSALKSHPAIRAVGEANRATFANKFVVERMIREYEEIYSAIVKRSGKAATTAHS